MKKIKVNAFELLQRVRKERPVIHHLTNWVTIYDCANVVKVFGASPVMAHAAEEVAEMVSIASCLVLNIGTLTTEFVEAMKHAARAAYMRHIPVVLDVCGAGATSLRDRKAFELLDQTRINVIKGNASEIARIAGETVKTRGVDATAVHGDLLDIAERLARKRQATVVITGKEDIVADNDTHYFVRNGHPMMSQVVGTGCMAASVIGTFAAVEKDYARAAVAGLVCFEVAAERAAARARGPGSFKEQLYDCIYSLDRKCIDSLQKVYR